MNSQLPLPIPAPGKFCQTHSCSGDRGAAQGQKEHGGLGVQGTLSPEPAPRREVSEGPASTGSGLSCPEASLLQMGEQESGAWAGEVDGRSESRCGAGRVKFSSRTSPTSLQCYQTPGFF